MQYKSGACRRVESEVRVRCSHSTTPAKRPIELGDTGTETGSSVEVAALASGPLS